MESYNKTLEFVNYNFCNYRKRVYFILVKCAKRKGCIVMKKPGVVEFFSQKLSHQSDSVALLSTGTTVLADLFFFIFLESFFAFLGAMELKD